MVTATFRFYEELNDFIARPLRRRPFSCACARGATAKHMIEAIGVPHTEVELILVNGESVGFEHPLADGDRVSVYPKFEALDVQPLLRVRERPLRVTRFVADAHLGGLAQLLRLAGFDTLYDNHYPDEDIEAKNISVVSMPNGGSSLKLSYDKKIPWIYNIDFLVHFEKSVPLKMQAAQE